MKPFILVKSEMQKRVFGAGYPSLPTMTLDEYYDKELKRIVEEQNNAQKYAYNSLLFSIPRHSLVYLDRSSPRSLPFFCSDSNPHYPLPPPVHHWSFPFFPQARTRTRGPR